MNLISIGNSILEFDELGSTNDYALDLLKGNKQVENGTVVYALSQTKGRGQRENSWQSEENKNLTFSIVLTQLNIDVKQSFVLSMAVALGVNEFLKEQELHNVKIKWPNDILVNNKKIAGILIENTIKGMSIVNSVVGVGININQTEFENLSTATSLKLENKNQTIELKSCLLSLLKNLEKQLTYLVLKKYSTIKNEYLNNLYGYQVQLKFANAKKEFVAQIVDVIENGEIILEHEDGDKSKHFFKEIRFLI